MTLEEINAEIEIVRKEMEERDGTRSYFHILDELIEDAIRNNKPLTSKIIITAFIVSNRENEAARRKREAREAQTRKENASC